jgi:hypothetical protein
LIAKAEAGRTKRQTLVITQFFRKFIFITTP